VEAAAPAGHRSALDRTRRPCTGQPMSASGPVAVVHAPEFPDRARHALLGGEFEIHDGLVDLALAQQPGAGPERILGRQAHHRPRWNGPWINWLSDPWIWRHNGPPPNSRSKIQMRERGGIGNCSDLRRRAWAASRDAATDRLREAILAFDETGYQLGEATTAALTLPDGVASAIARRSASAEARPGASSSRRYAIVEALKARFRSTECSSACKQAVEWCRRCCMPPVPAVMW
jgi:hypothetical protein